MAIQPSVVDAKLGIEAPPVASAAMAAPATSNERPVTPARNRRVDRVYAKLIIRSSL
jgi:hypothetical protein